MRALVTTTERADKDILEATTWWRQNRPDAPYLFEDELAEAFEHLAHQPEIGKKAPRPRIPNLRRLILARTRRHIYYEYLRKSHEVRVRSVWGAVRGRGPMIAP